MCKRDQINVNEAFDKISVWENEIVKKNTKSCIFALTSLKLVYFFQQGSSIWQNGFNFVKWSAILWLTYIQIQELLTSFCCNNCNCNKSQHQSTYQIIDCRLQYLYRKSFIEKCLQEVFVHNCNICNQFQMNTTSWILQ